MTGPLLTSLAGLSESLDTLTYLHDSDALWLAIQRLLRAHAPSGGVELPGAILDDITAIVESLGLSNRFIPHIGSTGNAGLWLGADKTVADVIVFAHMDRPSFKVRSEADGTLYPVCAIRFPAQGYQVPARALRFEGGKLVVSARGTLIYEKVSGVETLRMNVDSGHLTWQDTVVMDVEPTLLDGVITGTGLDNCLGVAAALGTAAALSSIEGALRAANRRIMFVFTDLEEGIPDAYFGHGAARLTFAVPPPTFGCIVADAQTAGAPGAPALGHGAGHGTVSGWSRGSFVPPNFIALAADLASEVNAARPGTVQINTGYLSRSDDVPLGRWTRILGMVGAPMTEPHTGEETARLADVQSAIVWLSYFSAAALALDPYLASTYALA